MDNDGYANILAAHIALMLAAYLFYQITMHLVAAKDDKRRNFARIAYMGVLLIYPVNLEGNYGLFVFFIVSIFLPYIDLTSQILAWFLMSWRDTKEKPANV